MNNWRRRGWKKSIAAFVLVISMLWAAGLSANAASVTDGINLVLGIDNNEELVYVSPGVCVNSGGDLAVFTLRYDSSLQAELVAVQTEEQICLLEYGDDWNPLEGYNLGLWIMREDSLANVNQQDSAFMQIGSPRRDESVTAIYYYMPEDELVKGSSAVMLRDMSKEGVLTGDGYPSGVMYPAALVNGKGELVGLLLDDGVCIAAGGNTETFYGSGNGSTGDSRPAQSPATAPPLPDRGSETATSAGNMNPSGNAAQTVRSGGIALVFSLGLAAVMVIAAVVVIVVLTRKKKQSPGAAAGTVQTAPAAGKAAVSPGGNLLPQQKETAGRLWLLARGGCMNGRVYPIEQNEITIGRDTTMVIRFPADTPGVSRIHAKLYRQGGQLMLMDCNSTSGTFLKRQGKIAPMVPVAVQDGDVFYIGEKTNSFEISTGR